MERTIEQHAVITGLNIGHKIWQNSMSVSGCLKFGKTGVKLHVGKKFITLKNGSKVVKHWA